MTKFRSLSKALTYYVLGLAMTVAISLQSPNPAFAKSVHEITSQELLTGTSERLSKVAEFRFIKEEAEKMGVRAFLFGGTASGFLHYVKWELQRGKGDLRFQEDRFDYDVTNIFRSTQDLDVVIDGPQDKILELQKILKSRYPHFLSSKAAKWELRSLRESRGQPGQSEFKEALLSDFDFMNQNTDSNSTGMIELTRANDPVVRDLRDWDNRSNNFLVDSAAGRIKFYRSKTHSQTRRARLGQNPEILSVVRALTKAFQFELVPDKESLAEMQKIVDEFNPEKILENSEAVRRIKDIGRKLFMHAVNLELAWDVIERMGLRKKLMAFDDPTFNKNANEQSLAWWMNREPLRSMKVGEGNGSTAEQLGISTVAHETINFLAYESITRAHTGEPNVFASREGVPGELASFGSGLYVKIGSIGARNTGFTIRFKLDPKAREGKDFIYLKDHDYLVILNKKAIKVIQESLKMNLIEYFRYLNSGRQIEFQDLALLEMLKRRLSKNIYQEFEQNKGEILAMVQKNLTIEPGERFSPVLVEWFKQPFSAQYPEYMEKLVQLAETPYGSWGAEQVALLLIHSDLFVQKKNWIIRLMKVNRRSLALHRYLIELEEQNKPDLELLRAYIKVQGNLIENRMGFDSVSYLILLPGYTNIQDSEVILDVFLKQVSTNSRIDYSYSESTLTMATQFLLNNRLTPMHPEWVLKVVNAANDNNVDVIDLLQVTTESNFEAVFLALYKKGLFNKVSVETLGQMPQKLQSKIVEKIQKLNDKKKYAELLKFGLIAKKSIQTRVCEDVL